MGNKETGRWIPVPCGPWDAERRWTRRRKCQFTGKAWGSGILSLLSILAGLLPLPALGADPGSAEEEPKRTLKSYLLSLEYGRPAQFLSTQKYANFHVATVALSREWEFRELLLPEKWNLAESLLVEIRLSHIWGKDIPLMLDEASQENLVKAQSEGRWPTVDWDHYQVAVTPLYRPYYPLSRKARFYAEIGAGFSWLNKPLVDNGTQWNFSLIAGVGLEREIYKIPGYVYLRAEHFSNGAQLWNHFGFDRANIGLESLVLGIGVRFR